MSAQEEPPDNGKTPDLDEELARVMAEAEAAVEGSSRQTHAGDPEPSDGDEVETEVKRLEGEVASLKDKWLRSVADLENYKKRSRRELEEAATRATQNLLKSFLPTVDNLQRALEVAGSEGQINAEDRIEQLVTGIEMVRDEFMKALAVHGISPIPAVGHPFDPSFHDALQQVDSEDHPPGVVVREFEKGYVQGERLLRPARVIVAGPGSTGPVQNAGEADENP